MDALAIPLPNGGSLPLVGLGTYTLHDAQLFEAASQMGYKLFDTAAKYGNEKELALGVKEKNDVFIISKVHDILYLGRRRFFHLDKKNIRTCFKESTKRMRGKNPDALLLHSVFNKYVEAYNELIELYESGDIKAIGICNCLIIDDLKHIKKQCGQYPMINQIEVHPYFYPKKLIEFCHENGIVVIARSPLAHGDILEDLHSKLIDIERRYLCTTAQLVLRWLTQKNIVVIPRTSNMVHLKENLSIFNFTLSVDDMREMDTLNIDRSFGFFSNR